MDTSNLRNGLLGMAAVATVGCGARSELEVGIQEDKSVVDGGQLDSAALDSDVVDSRIDVKQDVIDVLDSGADVLDAGSCGVEVTADQEFKSQTVLRGASLWAVGCFVGNNTCQSTAKMESVNFQAIGIGNINDFELYYIPKVNDQPVVDTVKQMVEFGDLGPADFYFQPQHPVVFCLAANVSNDKSVCSHTVGFEIPSESDVVFIGMDGSKFKSIGNWPVKSATLSIACPPT